MDSLVPKVTPHEDCVKVAVNIRPLITLEEMMGCTDCITIVPGEPQVQIGSHTFTYDHVYGNLGSTSSLIYEECVAPLVDSLFHGFNATVLAYGQTGSGKTYTMGTNYTGTGEGNNGGIIPKVMETIFRKVESTEDNTEYLIRVSFIEIFKEEVYDLLEGFSSSFKPAPTRIPIQIRETTNGGITLAGVTEAEVRTKEEMSSYLARGSLSRATGSTNMNSQSSRSHAIFTISMEIKRSSSCSGNGAINDEVSDDIVSAKLHLVDLAGSERAKRTGADGSRFKEGVHINRGLLALGNVISALGDEKKRKEGGHIPYRDSKLTRLLQDSLGGNSKTVMIACVSPADTNAEETINTLKYANRARNIQNKAVVNRDPMASQMQRMRSQLEQLQAELLYFRAEGAPLEELQILRHKISLLEASNTELRHELKERQINCEHLAQRALDAQVEKDKLIMKIESARNGKPWKEIDIDDNTEEFDLVKSYASKIQDLEVELLRLQSISSSSRTRFIDCLVLEDGGLHSKDAFLPSLHDRPSENDDKVLQDSGEAEEDEKEREHSTLQDRLDKELLELDKRLEQKEEEMKRFSKVDTSVLKQHYEKKVLELEHEKKALQKEIEDLNYKLSHISSASDDGSQKLKGDYLQKLNVLEAQVSELKRKQEAQSQLLRQKQKSDEASKRLQEEIQRIKAQKVKLQHTIKQESEQFRSWKASREKEVLQLKKEGRRNEYEMHKLLALNQRQKMVLQRKTDEASLATKRLKELLEVKKASSRELSGAGNANGPGMQKALMHAIEHELEVTVRVHEVRSDHERQLEARAAMANEMAKLKDELEQFKQKNMSDCPQTMSPSARNSRISALENMLATSSRTLVSMASQLSEAEERERIFSGKGHWNQVRSLGDAKNLMNYLFNLASSSRCKLWDKEVVCREKDSQIRELKEKVVKLSALVRQLEAENVEMHHWQNMQKLDAKGCSTKIPGSGASLLSNSGEDVQSYAPRQAPRRSQFFKCTGDNTVLLDDMDTSESEQQEMDDSDSDDVSDEEWVESGKKMTKKRSKRAIRRSKGAEVELEPRDSKELFDEPANKVTMSGDDVCCSCSKHSSCKTKKCECRSARNSCGVSCGCTSIKCSNRGGGAATEEATVLPSTEIPGIDRHNSESDSGIPKKSTGLAIQGAMLLQSALADMPSVPAEGGPQRKPLSDIGNTPVNTNTSKINRRKKWRKTVIQLVPAAPTQSSGSQQENNENAPSRPRDDVPLKLPRAMESPSLESNPLGEKNSNKTTDEHAGNKDIGDAIIPPNCPIWRPKASDDKENYKM